MSEENPKHPHNGDDGPTPFQPTESLPTQAAFGYGQAGAAPQGASASEAYGQPQQQGYGQDQGYGQGPETQQYTPQGGPPTVSYPVQGQQYQQQYGQGNPYAQQGGAPCGQQQGGPYGQQYAAQYGAGQQGQQGQQQFGQGGYYDQQGNYVPAQYGNQGGWNPPGGQPPKKGGFPLWGWLLALIALAAIVVGILFVTGVLGGGDDDEPTPGPSSSAPVTTPAPSPSTSPSPSPSTTPSPSPSTSPSASPSTNPGGTISEGSATVGEWTVEVVNFNDNANDILAQGMVPMTPNAGNKFIGVQMRLTNNGDAAADPYVEMYVSLTDESMSESIYEEFVFDRDDTMISIGDVEPGQSGEGWVFFEVPEDFSGPILEMWSFDNAMEDVFLRVQ